MNTFTPVNVTCLVGCEPGTVCARPWGWAHPHLCVSAGLVDRPLDAPGTSNLFWVGLLVGLMVALFLFLLPKGYRCFVRRFPEAEAMLVRLPCYRLPVAVPDPVVEVPAV